MMTCEQVETCSLDTPINICCADYISEFIIYFIRALRDALSKKNVLIYAANQLRCEGFIFLVAMCIITGN